MVWMFPGIPDGYSLLPNKSLSISETDVDMTGIYQCIAHQRIISTNGTSTDEKTTVFTDTVDVTIICKLLFNSWLNGVEICHTFNRLLQKPFLDI